MTKVKVKKTFAADAGYERQRDYFIAMNDLDGTYLASTLGHCTCSDISRHSWFFPVFYNFSVDLQIDGYNSHLLSYVDLAKKPKYLNMSWFVSASLTFFGALPYRFWVSSITGKIKPGVHKLIFTGEGLAAAKELLKPHTSEDNESKAQFLVQ